MFVVIVSLAARCGSSADAAAQPGDASAQPSPASVAQSATDPKAFCAAMLTAIQPMVKVPLTVESAYDAHNDDMHIGEAGYLQCILRHTPYGITLTLSDEKTITPSADKRFSDLPGFGDKARAYTGSLQWVDVMKGKTFCEAIVSLSPEQLTEDWKQAGGKMCMLAYAKR